MQPEIASRRRRVQMTVEEIQLAADALRQMTISASVNLAQSLQAIVDEEMDPAHRVLVDAYRAGVVVRDGEMEMDDDAEVSIGEDPGAYVMVWTWVSNEDASLPVPDDEEEEAHP